MSEDNTKVVTQEDLDANPVLATLGAAVGDTVAVTKPAAGGGDNGGGAGGAA